MYLVYVTFGTIDEARALASKLASEKLAACANIFPAHEAVYEWQDAVQTSTEIAVIFKTSEVRYPSLQAAIIDGHSYDEPCVIAWPIEAGSPPFLSWVESQVKIEG